LANSCQSLNVPSHLILKLSPTTQSVTWTLPATNINLNAIERLYCINIFWCEEVGFPTLLWHFGDRDIILDMHIIFLNVCLFNFMTLLATTSLWLKTELGVIFWTTESLCAYPTLEMHYGGHFCPPTIIYCVFKSKQALYSPLVMFWVTEGTHYNCARDHAQDEWKWDMWVYKVHDICPPHLFATYTSITNRPTTFLNKQDISLTPATSSADTIQFGCFLVLDTLSFHIKHQYPTTLVGSSLSFTIIVYFVYFVFNSSGNLWLFYKSWNLPESDHHI